MRFAFIYEKAEEAGSIKDAPPNPDHQEQQERHSRPHSTRTAAAAERVRTRGASDFHRTLACLDRMWHTISVHDFASPNASGQAIDWASDEVDSDEMFRPQAFRAPTRGGRA
ncbi:hypothetical protein ACWGSK_20735 [Nocardiopsis sp. NPDC055551]